MMKNLILLILIVQLFVNVQSVPDTCEYTGSGMCKLDDMSTDNYMQVTVNEPIKTTGCMYADREWGFNIKKGDNTSKVVLFLQGGGACSNAEQCTCPSATTTCNNSWPTAEQSYFNGYTKVVIPYCSGDTHFGDALHPYVNNTNVVHYGKNNTLKVLEWIFANYNSSQPESLQELVISSCSAGTVGVYYYSYYLIKQFTHRYPNIKITVVTSGFIPTILNRYAAWNACNFLDNPILNDTDFYANCIRDEGSTTYDHLVKTLVEYPKVFWGIYTSYKDYVQTAFMKTQFTNYVDDFLTDMDCYDNVKTYSPDTLNHCARDDNEVLDGIVYGEWVSQLMLNRSVNNVGLKVSCKSGSSGEGEGEYSSGEGEGVTTTDSSTGLSTFIAFIAMTITLLL